MNFKEHWDLDSALQVVLNETVDSRLWAEAVEWLLLFGPADIISILLQASHYASEACFLPEEAELRDFAGNGGPRHTPRHTLEGLAKLIGVSKNQVRALLDSSETVDHPTYFFAGTGSHTLH